MIGFPVLSMLEAEVAVARLVTPLTCEPPISSGENACFRLRRRVVTFEESGPSNLYFLKVLETSCFVKLGP